MNDTAVPTRIRWLQILADSFYFLSATLKTLGSYLILCMLVGIFFIMVTAYIPLLTTNPSLATSISILRFLVAILLQCGLLIFIDRLSQGQAITPWHALTIAVPKLMNYIVAQILVGVVIFVGLLCLILPGILLYARLILVDFFVVLSNEGRPVPALTNSLRATRGNTVNLVIIVVLCSVPILGITWLGIGHQIENPTMAARTFWLLVSWILIIFWTVVRYRCYQLLKKEHKHEQAGAGD